jgi:hypothetical protein
MFLFHGQIFKAISTYCSIYCCNECQASDHSWFFFCNIKRLMITMMTFEHVITRCEKKMFFSQFSCYRDLTLQPNCKVSTLTIWTGFSKLQFEEKMDRTFWATQLRLFHMFYFLLNIRAWLSIILITFVKLWFIISLKLLQGLSFWINFISFHISYVFWLTWLLNLKIIKYNI